MSSEPVVDAAAPKPTSLPSGNVTTTLKVYDHWPHSSSPFTYENGEYVDYKSSSGWSKSGGGMVSAIGEHFAYPTDDAVIAAAFVDFLTLLAQKVESTPTIRTTESREWQSPTGPKNLTKIVLRAEEEPLLAALGFSPVTATEMEVWIWTLYGSPLELLGSVLLSEFHKIGPHVALSRVVPLLKTFGKHSTKLVVPVLEMVAPAADITAWYFELVRVWGAVPHGDAVLKAVFCAKRLKSLASPCLKKCSCCAPGGDPVFFDEILDHLAASTGTVLDQASPGLAAVEVFWSLDPAYLDWFLTRYPRANLMVPAPLWTKLPYAAMFGHRVVTLEDEVEAMNAVLRRHGRGSVVDHGMEAYAKPAKDSGGMLVRSTHA